METEFYCPLCQTTHLSQTPLQTDNNLETKQGQPVLVCLHCAVQTYYQTARRIQLSTQKRGDSHA